MSPTSESTVRELDRRVNDGFDVSLLWSPETDRVFVVVVDQRLDATFEIRVDPADAIEAFHHPFAYAGATSGGGQPRSNALASQ